MIAEQSASVERALWVALRMLQERVSASRRLASRSAERNQPALAQRFLARAAELESRAKDVKVTMRQIEQATASVDERATQPID
jgi:hypothetical protein